MKPGASGPGRVGVLLLDADLRPIHYNAEAASILGYPNKAVDTPSLEAILPDTCADLGTASKPSLSAVEFASGRRRYVGRTFLLDLNGLALRSRQPRVVVVLERVNVQAVDLTHWSDQFQLTNRERETVELLIKGLTSKEIADPMRIGPNTVKSLLKLVMAKVGVSNRTGIVAKVFERAS